MKKKLVVIGNGMAGARVVEEILKRAPDMFEIAMFGSEPYGNYNRILLSNVLNQTQAPEEIFMNPLEWYQDNHILLHAGVKATLIDTHTKVVLGQRLGKTALGYAADDPFVSSDQIREPFDTVIIATGSRPFVPPIENTAAQGVFMFRTIDDCHKIAGFAKDCQKAIVIGGGLLGLEAARGLLTHNLDVTVVEAAPQLMPAQLDEESALMLKRTMEGMGVSVCLSAKSKGVVSKPDGKLLGLEFADGTLLEGDLLVISAGIRPITEIATQSGISVNKGIICNNQMRTSDPDVFALGECVEHKGRIYGLVEPIWEQARVLADVITGVNPNAEYHGSKLGTKLKVMGVELMSLGIKEPTQGEDELIVYREPHKGIYKKLIVRGKNLVGAILLGGLEQGDTLMQMFMNDQEVPENRADLLFGSVASTALIDPADLPDNAQVCNCNGVCKKQIVDAIENEGCTSVSAVGAKTKAGKGCGSCKGLIGRIIESTLGKVGFDPTEHYYVPGVPLEKSQLVAEIRNANLKSVSSVFNTLAGGREDPDSKPGLASLLKTLWPEEYEDERDARFINDRVHANIQKDGTFSVIPRMYGGVTTPEELMKIAQAAIKYNVKMVKVTGGQRIDLLGVKKSDLPGIWKDIGMPSGHAYTKAMRTCKSCVGSDFCRFGLGDSIALAQKIEYRYQGIESPHKMKMATTGCPRNCSEAYVKDIGVVAIGEEKWEIYIGGAAGSSIRKGDLLYVATGHDETIKVIDRFIQYYREHAKYLERTYHFAERIGIEILKSVLIEDSLGICGMLEARMQEAVLAYRDPWKEAEMPFYPSQFEGPRLIEVLNDAETNG